MKKHFLSKGLNKNHQSDSESPKHYSRGNFLHVIHHNDQNDNAKYPTITSDVIKPLIYVFCISTLFMIIEFIGGLISNSLAIITDAAHLLSDLTGLLISIYALHISEREPNSNFTFGYHRAEIVGAMSYIFLIWIITSILLVESIARLFHSYHIVKGGMMLITSSIGLIFNGIMAYVLHSNGRGHHHHHHHHQSHDNHTNEKEVISSLLKKNSDSALKELNDENNLHKHLLKSEIIKEEENHKAIALDEINDDKMSADNNSKSKYKDIHIEFAETNQIHLIEPRINHHLRISNPVQYQSPNKNLLTKKKESLIINRNLKSDFDMIDKGNLKKRKSAIITLKDKKTHYRNIDLCSPRISKHLTRDYYKFSKLGAFIGLKEENKESNSSFSSGDNHSESFYTISANGSSKDVNQSIVGVSPNKTHDSLRHSHNHSHNHKHTEINQSNNIQSLFICIISDIIQSIGVIIAASLIYFFPSYQMIDPLTTILFSLMVIVTTVPIIKKCVYAIMEGNPNDEVFSNIKNELINTPGVISVCCLHMYYLSLDKEVLCGHIKVIQSVNDCDLLKRINDELDKYNLYHCTIEISKEDSSICCNMMEIF